MRNLKRAEDAFELLGKTVDRQVRQEILESVSSLIATSQRRVARLGLEDLDLARRIHALHLRLLEATLHLDDDAR